MPSLFAPSLFARQSPLDDARTTLSSWDNCMAKDYCKWPVIVVIIIASLIVISVVMCVVRCICCGAECACCCFRCCAGCCGGSGRGHKRVKSDPTPTYPTYPTPYGAPAANPYAQAHATAPRAPSIDSRPLNQQYRSNAMPTFEPAGARPERPQFATFDSTRAVVNEDALPAMPTWKDGRDVHVEVEERPIPQKQGDMELDRLNHNGSVTSGSMAAAAVPGARRSPGSGRSPISPIGESYGFPPGYQNDSFVSEAAPLNNQAAYGRPYAQQDDYRRGSPAQNLSPVYGAGAGVGYSQQQPQPYGRRSPGQPQAYESHDQLGQYNQQSSYDQHYQQDPYDQRDYYDEPNRVYNTPPPIANPQNNTYNANPSHDNFAPAPMYQTLHTTGYTQSAPTELESTTTPAYPGQRSYTPVSGSLGQYRAFSPAASQGQQYSGVGRKPIDGSFREI
ncbi:hypothetical protein BDW02DRAFT_20776 [Decorospora gaudefroyi]|uniref:Fibroin-3 related protein n=1 Tax=Decorospora gaudefroyi TaxID=184978 RepID=A0A6A5K6B5_9PLEO|nr:hypothetical protein BDW02DRAFT_20776 [Decorospora gaudefroyi]